LLFAAILIAISTCVESRSACTASSKSVCRSENPLGEDGKFIVDLVNSYAPTNNLTAVLYRVTRNAGRTVIAAGAYGNSMVGVPATQAMYFRNGNVVFAYIAILMFKLQDAGKLQFTDKAQQYLPNITLPSSAENVTLEMLMRSTSGLRDYETIQFSVQNCTAIRFNFLARNIALILHSQLVPCCIRLALRGRMPTRTLCFSVLQ